MTATPATPGVPVTPGHGAQPSGPNQPAVPNPSPAPALHPHAARPHAARARAVTGTVLERLADPAATARDTRIPGEATDDGLELPLWVDLALSSGYPGVSLAFSGPARRGPEHATRGHAYLQRAMQVLAEGSHSPAGIYTGPGAVAFALLLAHRATGGYRSALDRLDAHQRTVVRTALPPLTDAPLATNGVYEVVRGLSGVGRYLLDRRESCGAELETVLRYLAHLAHGEVDHPAGGRVPRWWTMAAPKQGQEADLPDGHLNLGIAHGIAGPLALLSLAWRAGVRVDGQREGIENLVGLLRRCSGAGTGGLHPPGYVTLDRWRTLDTTPAPAHSRPSWCYGAPGTARAVQLAGLALDRADWRDLSHRTLLELLETPMDDWGIDDPGLCHGWAGLLHLFSVLDADIGDPRLAAARDMLAARTLDQFNEGHRFGFRATLTHVPQGADVPAFLEGAAGTALALDAYAHPGTHTGWDMALLIA